MVDRRGTPRAAVVAAGGAPVADTDDATLERADALVDVYARHQADPVGHLPYPGSHLAIAATANDRWVCTGNQDRSVHIWRTRDGNELEMAGYPDKVTHVVFDDTGRWLANNGAPDITVWDFAGKGPGEPHHGCCAPTTRRLVTKSGDLTATRKTPAGFRDPESFRAVLSLHRRSLLTAASSLRWD